MATCPRCSSEQTVKNGRIHNGKQNHRCRACGRQFILNPTKKVISDETKRRIDKLLLEKLPLAGIARVEDVSESWLQETVKLCWGECIDVNLMQKAASLGAKKCSIASVSKSRKTTET